MKKILTLMIAVIAISFTSCEENENEVFDNVNGQTLAFFGNSASSLQVVVDGTGTLDVQIGVTTVSSSERTVVVSLDEEASTANTENYTISNYNVTIPANEYFGTLTIEGVDNSVEIAAETIVLNLESVSGGIVDEAQHVVSVFQICPVEETLFTGSYLITQTTPFVDGPSLSDGTVVELTADGLNRTFDTFNYPNYCSTTNSFTFTLVCNEIFVPTQDSNCVCNSGAGWFSAAATPGTYDISDDTSFELTFTDDTESDCSSPAQTTYLFTKQ
ncbi:hypothetical protein [Lacinutrix sp. 5H-3-7-4]|uniref:hypothetical protein n=1 Tax=Lacinutrix sp. (strain 5H-3-7-4) TaxID=983544 RepID=UPI00020A364E|nr:hypothetical protein [Lacinutrix sp. 5H-3-7-4]AEH00275.1 hypothetical protein Lacal_0423 [Lacinutrix sp. 5H-3-7-4]